MNASIQAGLPCPPSTQVRVSRESHRLGLARAASNWPKPAIVGLLLALAIVRRIMETHGGSFRLDNRREDGARATLQFNLEPKKAV